MSRGVEHLWFNGCHSIAFHLDVTAADDSMGSNDESLSSLWVLTCSRSSGAYGTCGTYSLLDVP